MPSVEHKRCTGCCWRSSTKRVYNLVEVVTKTKQLQLLYPFAMFWAPYALSCYVPHLISNSTIRSGFTNWPTRRGGECINLTDLLLNKNVVAVHSVC